MTQAWADESGRIERSTHLDLVKLDELLEPRWCRQQLLLETHRSHVCQLSSHSSFVVRSIGWSKRCGQKLFTDSNNETISIDQTPNIRIRTSWSSGTASVRTPGNTSCSRLQTNPETTRSLAFPDFVSTRRYGTTTTTPKPAKERNVGGDELRLDGLAHAAHQQLRLEQCQRSARCAATRDQRRPPP
jgi:hypothetical protein